jgi:hypothetical protein
VRCISLWQPWATLIAIGAKRIETRSWPANYVGPLAIHAAQKWTRELRELCDREPFRSAFREVDVHPDLLPRGCVVATCRLASCAYVGNANLLTTAGGEVLPLPADPERSFGDYTPGRYAWLLSDVVKLEQPVPEKGRQGFWNWDPNAVTPSRPTPSLFPAGGAR